MQQQQKQRQKNEKKNNEKKSRFDENVHFFDSKYDKWNCNWLMLLYRLGNILLALIIAKVDWWIQGRQSEQIIVNAPPFVNITVVHVRFSQTTHTYCICVHTTTMGRKCMRIDFHKSTSKSRRKVLRSRATTRVYGAMSTTIPILLPPRKKKLIANKGMRWR